VTAQAGALPLQEPTHRLTAAAASAGRAVSLPIASGHLKTPQNVLRCWCEEVGTFSATNSMQLTKHSFATNLFNRSYPFSYAPSCNVYATLCIMLLHNVWQRSSQCPWFHVYCTPACSLQRPLALFAMISLLLNNFCSFQLILYVKRNTKV
jgi:hypothetical protein